MDNNLFFILLIIVGVAGLLLENKLKNYYTLVYKTLWYIFCFLMFYIIIFNTPYREWYGAEVILGVVFWVVHGVFCIFIAIESTVVLKGIIKPIIFLFMMNIILFFIVEEKEFVNGNVYFSFFNILRSSMFFLICQVPIIIFTRSACQRRDASVSNEQTTSNGLSIE